VADNYTATLTLNAKDNTGAAFQSAEAKLGQLKQQAQTSAQQVSSGLGNLQGAIFGGIAAVAGSQIIGMIGDLNALGEQDAKVQRLFDTLAGGSERAAAGIGVLRNATRGVVEDNILQSGANKLLITGLADNLTQVAQLERDAVTLGQNIGDMLPADAIESFTKMLATGSARGLAQFGLEEATVTARTQELTDAGMRAKDAFRQAITEEAGRAIDKLGSAADANATKLRQLQTDWENFKSSAAQGISGTIEIGANIIEQAGTAAAQLGIGQGDNQPLGQALGVRLHMALDPVFAAQVQHQMEIDTELQKQAGIERGLTQSRIANATAAQQAATNAAILAPFQQRIDEYQQSYGGAQRSLARFSGGHGYIGDTMLHTPGEVFWDQGMVKTIEANIKDMQALAKTLPDSMDISAQIEQWKALDDQAKQIASDAQKGADAFKNMTLPQALGQGESAFMGGFDQMIMDAYRKANPRATDKQLQAMQDKLDINSGAQNDLSIGMRDTIAPLLAGLLKTDPQRGIDAENALAQALEDARLKGIPLTIPKLMSDIGRDANGERIGRPFAGGHPLTGAPVSYSGYAEENQLPFFLSGGGSPPTEPTGMTPAQLQTWRKMMFLKGQQDTLGGDPLGGFGTPANKGGEAGGSQLPLNLSPMFGGASAGGGIQEAALQIAGIAANMPTISSGAQQTSDAFTIALPAIQNSDLATQALAKHTPAVAADATTTATNMTTARDATQTFSDTIIELTKKPHVVKIDLQVNDPSGFLLLLGEAGGLAKLNQKNGGQQSGLDNRRPAGKNHPTPRGGV